MALQLRGRRCVVCEEDGGVGVTGLTSAMFDFCVLSFQVAFQVGIRNDLYALLKSRKRPRGSTGRWRRGGRRRRRLRERRRRRPQTNLVARGHGQRELGPRPRCRHHHLLRPLGVLLSPRPSDRLRRRLCEIGVPSVSQSVSQSVSPASLAKFVKPLASSGKDAAAAAWQSAVSCLSSIALRCLKLMSCEWDLW